MSLKAVHIFFIVVVILFLVGFAAWNFRMYLSGGQPMMAVYAGLTIVAAGALTVYGIRFVRKLRHVSYL